MSRRKHFDQLCLSCHNARAIWAIQHYFLGEKKHQVRYRPDICNDCANHWTERFNPAILTYRKEDASRVMLGESQNPKNQTAPTVLLLNKWAHKLNLKEQTFLKGINQKDHRVFPAYYYVSKLYGNPYRFVDDMYANELFELLIEKIKEEIPLVDSIHEQLHLCQRFYENYRHKVLG